MLGLKVTRITLVYAEKVKFIAFTFPASHRDRAGRPQALARAVGWGIVPIPRDRPALGIRAPWNSSPLDFEPPGIPEPWESEPKLLNH